MHPAGHVHEEHRLPAQVGDEESADGRSGNRAQAHHAQVRSQRLAAFGIGECGKHHSHAAALHHAGSDALPHAHGDQHFQRRCKGGAQGGDDEYAGADHINPTASDDIAQATHGQQENADNQCVGNHHPLDGFQCGVEVGLDPRQRYENAAVVNDGKEGARGDGPEVPPSVGAAGDDALNQSGWNESGSGGDN